MEFMCVAIRLPAPKTMVEMTSVVATHAGIVDGVLEGDTQQEQQLLNDRHRHGVLTCRVNAEGGVQ